MGRAAALHYPLRHLPGIPFAIPLGISVSPGCAFLWLRYPAQLGRSACPDSTPDLHPCCFPACTSLSKTVLAASVPVTIGDKGLCCHCQTHHLGSPSKIPAFPQEPETRDKNHFPSGFCSSSFTFSMALFPLRMLPDFTACLFPPCCFWGDHLCPLLSFPIFRELQADFPSVPPPHPQAGLHVLSSCPKASFPEGKIPSPQQAGSQEVPSQQPGAPGAVPAPLFPSQPWKPALHGMGQAEPMRRRRP